VGGGQWAEVSGQWAVGSGQVVRGGPIDCGTVWYLRLGFGWHHGSTRNDTENRKGLGWGLATTNDTNDTNGW